MSQDLQSKIENNISQAFTDAEVLVELDGNRALLRVVSNDFAPMNRVQKQQAVYACVADLITDGTLHAVTIKAELPAQ